MEIMARSQERRARGYTAVEVMMALGLLAVGAAGIIAIERGALVGSAQSRDVDVANQVAMVWIERLRTDATTWTRNGWDLDASADAGGTVIGTLQGTRYLMEDPTTSFIDRGRSTSDLGWFLPNQGIGLTPPQSPAFDAFGRDLDYLSSPAPSPTQPEVHFCTHARIECLTGIDPDSGVGNDPARCVLLRVQVRVFWPKVNNGLPNFCRADNMATIEDSPQNFHYVYATTALRQNS